MAIKMAGLLALNLINRQISKICQKIFFLNTILSVLWHWFSPVIEPASDDMTKKL